MMTVAYSAVNGNDHRSGNGAPDRNDAILGISMNLRKNYLRIRFYSTHLSLKRISDLRK